MTAAPASYWGPAYRAAGQCGAAEWTAEQVRELLAAYGRTPARLAVDTLPGGWENLNLRIQSDGERFVLRRYDVTDPAEVPWEMEVLRFLTRRDFPTPALIERIDGGLSTPFGGRPAALFAFAAGRHPAWNDPTAAALAARVTALLHQTTAGRTFPGPRTRQDNRLRLSRFLAWMRERGSTPDEPLLRRLAHDVGHYAAEFAARVETVEAAHGPLPRGAVHHDAHGNNLLVDDGGNLVALLDFDDAHETFLVADVAALVNYWGLDRADEAAPRFDARSAAGVVRAYDAARPLTAGEWDLLPDALALFNLADATSYVAGRMARGTPADQAIADCDSYASFRERTVAPDWRNTLRAALSR
jgi:Ser/Thr protein kinase RdoA (MazF antagonist)